MIVLLARKKARRGSPERRARMTTTSIVAQEPAKSSTNTKTLWTESIKEVCFAILNGLEKGEFKCPFFGTAHEIYPPSEEIPSYITAYRGYVYYACSAKNRSNKPYWVVGLCDCGKNNIPIYRPIIAVSQNNVLTHYYNFHGEIEYTETNGNV